jgi:hypothetical protein
MIDRLLAEAKAASELARQNNTPNLLLVLVLLLFLVFCHGIPLFNWSSMTETKTTGLVFPA